MLLKLINYIFLAMLFVYCSLLGFSQAEIPDSIVNINYVSEIISVDTIVEQNLQPIIDSPIDYNSIDSMAFSLEDGQQIVHLYGGATINYGSINLEADYISMNFENKEIFASVMRDSLGNINNKTLFSEGSETFECETLRYNFVTGKAFVANVVTEQQDGFVRSSKAKMMSKDIYCMVDGKYSTCDAEHPHFYLQMTKGKVIREKAIITGRSYLVLEDFPIYVPFLPYGYIPTNKKTYSSGVIIPSYGEETQYGFYLRDGGFYWAASDYFDLRLTGDIYSKGKWAVNTNTRYGIRYKFSGSFGLSYSQNVSGERGINQIKSPSFRISWSHNQDTKANPSQTFSVSINFSSSGFNKENEFNNVDKFLENSAKSTISYRKDFLNTPFSLSSSFSIDQNKRDTTLSVSIPSLVFKMKTIYPFRNNNRVGKKKPWEDIQIGYTGNYDSRINTKQYLLLSTPYSDWNKSIRHNLPITLPSFSLFKHINVVPSFGFNERWYFEYTERYWIDGFSVTDNETGLEQWVSGHVEEVMREKLRRNYDFNLGVSASTTLYGLYNMVNPNWRVKAVRHKIDPRIGFSYNPDFSNRFFGFYEWVQVDSLGNYKLFNMFPSGSATAGKSGAINFGLSNNVEMKVANLMDTTTTEAFKKVAIFDNLSFNGSYNLMAEQFNLSNISINARTKIARTSININATLDPYALNEKGEKINEYMWSNAKGISKLGRIVDVRTGYSFNYSSDKFKKAINKGKTEEKNNEENNNSIYEPFDMPWNVSLSYTFSYVNTKGTPNLMQSVSLNGNIDITPKWRTSFSSGFDFMAMKITHTKMTITRDLHCWTMSFDFSPISSHPYYMFTIRANASMLKDLKVERTKY